MSSIQRGRSGSPPASGERNFQSFFLGGFECATHRRHHTGQIDVIHATQHDHHAEADFRTVGDLGIRTVRDGLRWHLIERTPGVYDWSSFLPMLRAALTTGTQVIWDLCHWGVPEGLDPFSPQFISRFAAFALAAAKVFRDHTDQVPYFCPINEISFWSWGGGDRGFLYPYGKKRGDELKRRLAEGSIAAIRRIREAVPEARFVQCEPVINISANNPRSAGAAARHTTAQFQAWDMLCGRLEPELGGNESCLDLIGCNYYWNNQWVHRSHTTPLGHPRHRPLHRILTDVYARYQRPMLISETGAEADAAHGWLGMICSEARQAMAAGVDLQGICLYPVMDYPGWDDRRHCACGLISVDEDWSTRSVRTDLARELALQEELFARQVAEQVSGQVLERDNATAVRQEQSVLRLESVLSQR